MRNKINKQINNNSNNNSNNLIKSNKKIPWILIFHKIKVFSNLKTIIVLCYLLLIMNLKIYLKTIFLIIIIFKIRIIRCLFLPNKIQIQIKIRINKNHIKTSIYQKETIKFKE